MGCPSITSTLNRSGHSLAANGREAAGVLDASTASPVRLLTPRPTVIAFARACLSSDQAVPRPKFPRALPRTGAGHLKFAAVEPNYPSARAVFKTGRPS